MENLTQLNHTETVSGPKILIAENDEVQRAIWRQIMSVICKEAEIHWSDSYEGASQVIEWSAAQYEDFDLVILDVFLNGERTGFQICQDYFHALRGKVVLVSNFGNLKIPSSAESSLNQEPFYLNKPLNPNSAMAMVKNLLKPNGVIN
jgi:DNA-binding NtrC family response regulator